MQFTALTNCFLENMALYEICAGLLYQSIDVYTHIYIFKSTEEQRAFQKAVEINHVSSSQRRERKRKMTSFEHTSGRKRAMQFCECEQNKRKYESNTCVGTICFITNGGLNCGRNIQVQALQISEATAFNFIDRRNEI